MDGARRDTTHLLARAAGALVLVAGSVYAIYRHFPADRRWELIDGEAHVVPSPNRRHQRIAGELYHLITNHLAGHGGGEVYIAPFDVVLSDILQPDVVFIASNDLDVHALEDGRYDTPSRHRPPDVVRPRALPSFEADLGEAFGSV